MGLRHHAKQGGTGDRRRGLLNGHRCIHRQGKPGRISMAPILALGFRRELVTRRKARNAGVISTWLRCRWAAVDAPGSSRKRIWRLASEVLGVGFVRSLSAWNGPRGEMWPPLEEAYSMFAVFRCHHVTLCLPRYDVVGEECDSDTRSPRTPRAGFMRTCIRTGGLCIEKALAAHVVHIK